MRKILPLKGYKSLRGMNAFHALMLGLKMLPANQGISYEKFFEDLSQKSDSEKETAIRMAISFVNLTQEEFEALMSFATDKNGIPYTSVNLANLSPDEIHETLVAVCMEYGKIKVDIVSEEEKKKFPNSQST